MVKFCFLIRITKTFEGLGFCLVDCSGSSLFSGRAESRVKQARCLAPAFKYALILRFARLSPDSESLLKFCPLGTFLTLVYSWSYSLAAHCFKLSILIFIEKEVYVHGK